jgi:hypothetical protein
MTTIQRGTDSLDAADTFVSSSCVGGLQTVAWRAKNCLYAKGGCVVFWGRYFQNFDFPTGVWRAIEARALSDSDVSWVLPISQPGQGRLDNSFADGQADGLEFIGNVKGALLNMNQIGVPDTSRVNCYLDIENNFFISTAYWQGWADAVNMAEYPAGSGQRPFYACAYIGSIGTGTGTTNCNTIQNAGSGSFTCYGIWSNQPQLTGGCATGCDLPGPSWAPNNCSSAPTVLWQYADSFVCNNNCARGTNVDLNLSTPIVGGTLREDQTDHMLFIRSGDLTPAVAAQQDGPQVDVVVRGANGRIYRTSRPSPGLSWSAWELLGALPEEAASNPTAVWRSASGQLQLEVLVRSRDKRYWRNFWRLGTWSGWQLVGDGTDQLQSSPSADGPASGQLHTVYTALGGPSVKQRYLVDGSPWQLFDLGAPSGVGVASNPAGLWWAGDNKYDVFVRGTDNVIYNREWNSVSGWHPSWFSVGVSSQVQPAAAALGISSLYVIFVPVGGTTIQYRSFVDGLGWQPVVDLGAPTPSGAVAAATGGWCNGGTHFDVATRGSDNYLYVKTYTDGSWSNWSLISKYPGLSA